MLGKLVTVVYSTRKHYSDLKTGNQNAVMEIGKLTQRLCNVKTLNSNC